ncbi:NAD(P)-dependent oxidoreductase [Eubacteriaceae bacterium ES3]|nr:NAD(P)-dependent oxidoreductase [Eubacteriaceae bacterium ES3]
MCARLKKEKHDVFVLTGEDTGDIKSVHVFQDYRFAFNSESITSIMKSVTPEIVIFCGAQDESYDWENSTVYFVQYISGLMNILLCANAIMVKKFIYLSTCNVFDGNVEEVVNEMTIPIAVSERSKRILQGEQVCRTNLGGDKNFETIIVRLPEIYGIEGSYYTPGICAEMANVSLNRLIIEMDHSKKYNLMHLDDAVDGIYKVIISKSDVHLELPEVVHTDSSYKLNSVSMQEPIIHFTTDELNTQREIKEVFEKCSEITIESIEGDEQQDTVFQKKNYPKFESLTQKFYGFSPKYPLEAGICDFYKKFSKLAGDRNGNKNKRITNQTEKIKKIKKIFMPLIETVLAFIIVQMFIILTQRAVFHQVVDVYLLYVIVIAVTLGSMPAVIAFFLSVIGKLGLIFTDGNLIESITNYELYLWMIQLFLISILTGYIKDYYKRMMSNMKEENIYLKHELESVKEINTSNVEVKNVFEERLVNYRDSYAKVSEMLSELDELEAIAVMFKAAPVIAKIINSPDVAIYIYESKYDYCRLIAATTETVRKKGKSFKLQNFSGLSETIKTKGVFMNRTLKAGYPMLASGTYNEEKLEVIIMVWSMEIDKINLHVSNMLSMASKSIERSMSRAVTYMNSVKQDAYIAGTNILETKAFRNMLEIYCQGEYEGILEYSLLIVLFSEFSEEQLFKKLDHVTRETDYLGLGTDGKVYVLLTNSNELETKNVIGRFAENGIDVASVKRETGKTVDEVFTKVLI